MAGTLREELASLKIDRPDPEFSRTNGHRESSGADGRRRRATAAVVVPLADSAGPAGGAAVHSRIASTTRSGRSPRSRWAWCSE